MAGAISRLVEVLQHRGSMIPNIPEHSRNRKRTERGRKRLFNVAIHALRMRVEQTFAWEEKCKQLLLRWKPS